MDVERQTNAVKDAGRDWKHIHHQYDEHYERRISRVVHRGDLSSTTRLLGYTDAMMATCATFLVIPIRHVENESGHDNDSLSAFLDSSKLEIVTFFIGFLIVCTIWESINIRAIVVKRLDDFLVLFSIASMLVTTVLPFAIALQGHYPGDDVTVISTTMFLTLFELLEILMVVYAFASPNLLHIEFSGWKDSDVKEIQNALLTKSFANIIFISLAALFELLDYRISWAILAMLCLNPLLRQFYLYVRRKRARSEPNSQHSEFYWFLSKGNISKERVEAFTDAATAIIACVLILDITVEEFPELDELKPGKLWNEIKHMKHELYTFFGAYVLVSLLWYVNHTVLHLYHTINTITLYTQKIFLCFLSLMPLCSNILNHFTFKGQEEADQKLGIRVAAILTFLASGCNAILLMWGIYKEEKVLHEWALNNATKRDKLYHMYIIIKVANMPYWAFMAFVGSFARADVAYYIFVVCFISMILSFFGVKFFFVNHVGKKILTRFSNRMKRHIVSKKKVEISSKENTSARVNYAFKHTSKQQVSFDVDGTLESSIDIPKMDDNVSTDDNGIERPHCNDGTNDIQIDKVAVEVTHQN